MGSHFSSFGSFSEKTRECEEYVVTFPFPYFSPQCWFGGDLGVSRPDDGKSCGLRLRLCATFPMRKGFEVVLHGQQREKMIVISLVVLLLRRIMLRDVFPAIEHRNRPTLVVATDAL